MFPFLIEESFLKKYILLLLKNRIIIKLYQLSAPPLSAEIPLAAEDQDLIELDPQAEILAGVMALPCVKDEDGNDIKVVPDDIIVNKNRLCLKGLRRDLTKFCSFDKVLIALKSCKEKKIFLENKSYFFKKKECPDQKVRIKMKSLGTPKLC